MKRSAGPVALGLAGTLLWIAGSSRALAAEISTPKVAIEGRHVLISVELAGGFDDEVLSRIESGLATTFDFEFDLLRDRKRWLDAGLASSRLQVTAMYNGLTRDYLVNFKLDGRLIESRLIREREALGPAMSRVDRLALFPVESLPRGVRVLVRARALLDRRSWSILGPSRVSTAWRESSKFRAPRSTG